MFHLVKVWILWTVFSSLCAFIREVIFGVTSQRVGRSLRSKLFKTILNKDMAFYDSFKTGDMLSRLGSDTQVVQDGLTTNVAMLVKAACIAVGCIAILCMYNIIIGLTTLAIVLP